MKKARTLLPRLQLSWLICKTTPTDEFAVVNPHALAALAYFGERALGVVRSAGDDIAPEFAIPLAIQRDRRATPFHPYLVDANANRVDFWRKQLCFIHAFS